MRTETVRRGAAVIFCVLILSLFGWAYFLRAAAEEKLAVSIEAYSGEWKAAPDNPALTRPQNAIDGDPATAWYAQWGKADDCYADAPGMTLDFGGEKIVSRIEICMANDYVPRDILVELGDGAGAWAEAGRYRDMAAGEVVVCHVPLQSAEKLRVTVMEKSAPDNNGYSLVKIAEITAFTAEGPALDGLDYYRDITSGTVICSDGAQRSEALLDGVNTVCGKDGGEVISDLYTDYVSDSAACDGVVAYSFSAPQIVGKLSLWGSSDEGNIYGFPQDFAVVYSPDGSDWYIVPNQVYHGFEPSGGENAFVFDQPVFAKAIGIGVLTKTTVKNGSYAVSLNEMRVFSSPYPESVRDPLPSESADSSVITAVSIPNGIYSGEEIVSFNLEEYFSSEAGALHYSSSGIGSVEGNMYRADLAGVPAGRYNVTVTAWLNDFCRKQITFEIAVQGGDKVFVLPVTDRVEKSAAAGETIQIDLAELFYYTGHEALCFRVDAGELSGGTLTLRYESSGSYNTEIVCYPESDESLGAKVILTVVVGRNGVDSNTLAILDSVYHAPAASYALAGGIAGAVTVAGVAVAVVLMRRRSR